MPEPVLAAMVAFEVGGRANVHRGLYPLAAQASTAYESARAEVAGFISAPVESLEFTKSTTEGLNLVACGIAARLGPGDEVLVLSPYWVSFPSLVQLSGATPIIVETSEEDGFVPEVDAVRARISDATKAIIVNSPSNPTGVVLSEAELRQAAELADKHNLLLIIFQRSTPNNPLGQQRGNLRCQIRTSVDFLLPLKQCGGKGDA